MIVIREKGQGRSPASAYRDVFNSRNYPLRIPRGLEVSGVERGGKQVNGVMQRIHEPNYPVRTGIVNRNEKGDFRWS